MKLIKISASARQENSLVTWQRYALIGMWAALGKTPTARAPHQTPNVDPSHDIETVTYKKIRVRDVLAKKRIFISIVSTSHSITPG
jgi:hypothetical protein